LVQCCLVGPTTSSLALRATAKGGCGLDLAVPTRPLTSKRSTPRCADIVGSIVSRGKTTCLLLGYASIASGYFRRFRSALSYWRWYSGGVGHKRGKGFRPAPLMTVLRLRARGPPAGQCRSGDRQHIVAGSAVYGFAIHSHTYASGVGPRVSSFATVRTEHYEVQPGFDTNVGLYPHPSGIGPRPGPGTWIPPSKDPSHYSR
jgi:hypothetical protein